MHENSTLLTRAGESLAAAKFLMEGGYPSQAASRAYYSMLYLAHALVGKDDIPLSEESKVIAAFGGVVAAGKAGVDLHAFLIDAYALRIAADEKCAHLLPEEAKEQISHAEEFLKLAERLIGPIPTED